MRTEEVTIQCLSCKEMQSVEKRGNKFLLNYKFVQIGDKIYHLKVCGEVKVIK